MARDKRIEFEIKRGRLASSAMIRFKDIFMKLGIVKSEVKDGLRSYKINDSISFLDDEDYEKSLQGVSEKTIDGLYDAYAEMYEGTYDALWEASDFSDEEKANGYDRTYNKNADEMIRQGVSLVEVLSSIIRFWEDGKIAKLNQSSEPGVLERE